MDKDVADLYKYNHDVFQYNYQWLQAIEARIGQVQDLEELADYGYAMKRLAELVDDTRKHANRISELAQRLQCALQVGLMDLEPVRTEYCTASPAISQQMSVPKKEKDPEQYYAIMDLLGISREVADKEAVRPHWPGLTEVLTELAQQGKPLPEGINPNNVKPVYSVKYRKKNDAEF